MFNPYYIDSKLLRDGIAARAGALEGRLLDVGCGERPYEELFTRIRRYVGVEHLGAVRNVAPEFHQSITHIRTLVDAFGEGENLPFRDASFDGCLCVEVLEHVPDPDRVVGEIRRVLKVGGRLLVTVPFVGELHQVPYDFRRFTRFGLEALLAAHGFELESLDPRGNFQSATGRLVAHGFYRLGARALKKDGSVSLSRWAAPIILPLVALSQFIYGLLSKVSRDETLCLGYVALARRVR